MSDNGSDSKMSFKTNKRLGYFFGSEIAVMMEERYWDRDSSKLFFTKKVNAISLTLAKNLWITLNINLVTSNAFRSVAFCLHIYQCNSCIAILWSLTLIYPQAMVPSLISSDICSFAWTIAHNVINHDRGRSIFYFH